MTKNHLTKKEMQVDELRDALEGARDYVTSHQAQTTKWVALGVAAAVLVAAIWGGLAWRSRQLDVRFSLAVGIFDEPLVTDGVGAAPGKKVYKDAAERLADARKALEELVKDAPSSTPGEAASALLLGIDGKKGISGGSLDRVAAFSRKESGSIAAGVAAYSLLQAKSANGQTKEAIDLAKKYLETTSSPLPKDLLIYTLGQLSEKAGQTAEAKSYYQRVVSDFPDSPVRSDAQQRSQSL